ncbi:MAG: MBL fold metallo-hydrolase [Sulfurimonas sp.]
MQKLKKERIKILGAYGTRSINKGTSSILLNSKRVIDAGNLLEALREESVMIEEIWLTHSHLDHIVDIAYIIDNYFTQRIKSLKIMGLPQTLKALKEHFLNDAIWPDFSIIKMAIGDENVIEYIPIEIGKKYKISENEFIEAFASDHTVASCGYIYERNSSRILIGTDTYSLDNYIDILDNNHDIKSCILECSFSNEMEILAKASKHLTPKLLFQQLQKLQRDDLLIYINHIKPIYEEKISAQIEQYKGKWQVEIIKDGFFLTF